jgi:ABC-2 type transport system permease protein
VGEEKLNRAIAEYVKAVKFQMPPYTTTVDFLSYIRPIAPPNVVRDLFESITLYENRATEATVTKRGNQWVVKMTVEAKKFRSDGGGRETAVPLDDWIDVGVLAGKDVIAVEKRRITQPVSTIELVVNKEPTKAGIDPLNKLIDRNPDDNVAEIGGP